MTGRLRKLRVPVLVGAAAGLIGWLFGVVVADAAMIGLLVAAGLAAPRLATYPEPVVWPAAPEPRSTGAWYEVRRLSTVLNQTGDVRDVFDVKVRPRLRDLAEARLAELGVRWSDPAARRLLGPDVHSVLDGRGGDIAGRSPVALIELVLGRLAELPGVSRAPQEGSR